MFQILNAVVYEYIYSCIIKYLFKSYSQRFIRYIKCTALLALTFIYINFFLVKNSFSNYNNIVCLCIKNVWYMSLYLSCNSEASASEPQENVTDNFNDI